ncbi:hypothetical protein D3C71_1458220 [compost metagenome]
MAPVTYGSASGSTALPSRALATPAPSRSATARTSSPASSAPAPTSIATRSPWFRMAAALSSAASGGTAAWDVRPMPVCTVPCSRGGASTASRSCTSLGKIRQVTPRRSMAIRMARSTMWRA